MVTIGDIDADVLNDVTVCDSYTLPVLSADNHYFTGSNGTGTELAAGTAVTVSQTIYIYAQVGTCTDESSFIVTVNPTPVVADPSDVAACDSYTLGVPPAGHYYGQAGGLGAVLDNTTLTASQTVWIYASTGTAPDLCWAEADFEVVITPSPAVVDPADVTECDSYALGVPDAGHYYSAPNGGGAVLDNTTLTSSQTVYLYVAQGACSGQQDFGVTIVASPAFTIQTGCQGAEYVLEAVAATGHDFSLADYTWSVSGGGSILSGNGTGSITASGAGDYTLTVSIGDCDHSETVSVDNTGCTIQKGISPNGDGLNDYFDLEGQNVTRLQIFNRYGTVVYKKTDYTNQWYGQTDGGDELPDGTYYYVVERAEGAAKTGWIYINRERN